MTQSEIDYLNRRAQQHRDRSASAGDPTARRLHEQFAASYTARASELASRVPA
jgi:DnaJ-domain-containing protein 1